MDKKTAGLNDTFSGKTSPKRFTKNPIKGTKFTIAISSAKGGVGKSTFAMNFALAFVIYTGVSAFWGMPEIDETRVARVDSDALPPGAHNLGRLESGATLVTIGENTVSHWGDVRDAFLAASSGPLEISTENADSNVEIDLPADIDERMAIVQALYPWQDNVIGSINPGSPAERGGSRSSPPIRAQCRSSPPPPSSSPASACRSPHAPSPRATPSASTRGAKSRCRR